jgi:hypothetical protein
MLMPDFTISDLSTERFFICFTDSRYSCFIGTIFFSRLFIPDLKVSYDPTTNGGFELASLYFSLLICFVT